MAELDANGLYRTKYGLMPSLGAVGGAGRRAGADEPAGFLADEQRIARENAALRAELAAQAEVLAPEVAKRQGITEDEARQQLTGGVAEQEGPLHWVGRQTLGRIGLMDRTGPTGEPIQTRVGRLSGMAVRSERDIAAQERAFKHGQELYGWREGVDNPDALSAPALSELRKGGVDLGTEANIHFRHKPPATIGELYGQGDIAGARGLADLTRRATSETSAEERETEQLARSLLATGRADNLDEARILAFRALRERGGEPHKTSEEAIYEKFAGSADTQAALGDEESEFADWQRKDDGSPRPAMPFHTRLDALRSAAEAARAGNVRGVIGRGGGGGVDDFLDAVGVPRGPSLRGVGRRRPPLGPAGPLVPQGQ